MDKDNKNASKNNIENQTFFAASTTDCTGLIPSLPTDMEEIESYNEIYRIYPDYEL